MNQVHLDTIIKDNKESWLFIGVPEWNQDHEGIIYPPIWSNSGFDTDPAKVPDFYADDLAREDYAFLTEQPLSDIDISVEYKAMYGSVVHGGIVFRAINSLSFYVVDITDISPHDNQAYEFTLWIQDEKGYRKQLAKGRAPHSIVPEVFYRKGVKTRDEWYNSSPDWVNVRIQASGTYIRVSMDGSIVLEHRDTAYAAGYIGLTGRGPICFRNLMVSGEPADLSNPWHKFEGEFPRFFLPGAKQPDGGSSYPKVCRTDDGLTSVVWAHAPAESTITHSQSILFTCSDDEGKTWSKPCIIFETNGERCVSNSIYAHLNGSLSCYIYVFPKEEGRDIPKTVVVRSSDGGKTWSETGEFLAGKKPLSNTEMLYSPLLRLADGTVVMTGVEYKILPGGDAHSIGGRLDRSLFFRSTDDGYTWKEPIIFNPDTFDNAEAVVAEIEPGKLIALMSMKSAPYKWITQSINGGKTWTPMIPTKLRGYCSNLFRHSSGALILANRSFGVFSVLSFDGGQTWSEQWRISQASGMMDMMEMADGEILVVMNEGYRIPGNIRGQFLRITPYGPRACLPTQPEQR